MNKLTDEQKYELATKFFANSWNTRVAVGLIDAVEAEVLRMSGTTDAATIAGLESAVGHLSRLCDDQRALLVEMEGEFGVDGHYGQLEDGEHPLIDRVRAHIAQTQYSTPRATGCPDTMDDMGRFAEVDMPAFLRKQAG